MITVQPGSGPTVLRILLGSQLRRLREARGITREDAGYTIRASGSKISRMELGRVGFKERDVVDLLEMYGVADVVERDALVVLARQANTPGWWHKYSDVLPDWFQVYVGLEEAALLIRLYEVQFVPGLLQTADYARAVVTLGQPGAPEEEIERRVSLRVARQELLAKAGALESPSTHIPIAPETTEGPKPISVRPSVAALLGGASDNLQIGLEAGGRADVVAIPLEFLARRVRQAPALPEERQYVLEQMAFRR